MYAGIRYGFIPYSTHWDDPTPTSGNNRPTLMFTSLAAISRNAFIESVRQPIFPAMLLLAGIMQLFNTWSTGFSMEYTTTSEVVKDDKLLLDIGLAGVFVFGMLLAAFTATAVLSREIEDKTVLTVVSKPIGRPVVILGKFLGVAGALIIAVVVMSVFLLIGLRHGVMSTAADRLDMPVIIFSGCAVGIALLFSSWSNFFYGWSFPQTLAMSLTILLLLAYFALIFVDPRWNIQPLFEVQWYRDRDWMSTAEYLSRYSIPPERDYVPDNPVAVVSGRRIFFPVLLPQVTLACVGILLGILVLCAVATAASTRLGQVMTIVVCAGVFVVGLLSNHLLGRLAYSNTSIGKIQSAYPYRPPEAAFNIAGQRYSINLETVPAIPVEPESPFFYGPSPNGFALAASGSPSPVILLSLEDRSGTVMRTEYGRINRPPQQGDFIFVQPTKIRPIPATLYAIIPNMQHYWLADAVSQNNPIPTSHMVRLILYALLQIGAFLGLGVVLFQERDVG